MGERLDQHLQILTSSCRRCLETGDVLAWRNLSIAIAVFPVDAEAAHPAEVHELAASARLLSPCTFKALASRHQLTKPR